METDNYGLETEWIITDANGRIIAYGNTSGGANASDLGNADGGAYDGGANDLSCRTDRGGTGRTSSHDFYALRGVYSTAKDGVNIKYYNAYKCKKHHTY